MKYNIKITNLTFDIEIEAIGSVDPPVDPPVIEPPIVIPPVDPPVVEPPIVIPPVGEFKNIQAAWDGAFADPTVDLIVIDGKCEVPVLKTQQVSRKITIKGINNAILKFGVEKYNMWTDPVKQAGSIIRLLNGAEVLIKDVNICQPPQITETVNFHRPSIFSSDANVDSKWTAVVQNCDTSILGRNGAFGLGFVYGGRSENHIAAINFKHAGTSFIDGKAAIGGSQDTVLYITLDNVKFSDPNPEEFGTWRIPVQAKIKDNVFTITSDDDTNSIRNYFFSDETVGNYAYIIHMGRYTFMIKPSNVVDLKNIKLYPVAKGDIKIRVFGGKVYPLGKEGHAGDTFVHEGKTYITVEKTRDFYPRWTNADNAAGMDDIIHIPNFSINQPMVDGYYDVHWTSSFDQEDVEQKAWMLYKESSYGFRSYVNTPFEHWEIMQGGAMGHTMYNHRRISLWAKDVQMDGFYRQTDPGGKSLGYNMVNCTGFGGQFNPADIPVTTDKPMPDRIKNLINE